MKSFYQTQRDAYMEEFGYDYKEASRHAKADEDMWYELLMGKKREEGE